MKKLLLMACAVLSLTACTKEVDDLSPKAQNVTTTAKPTSAAMQQQTTSEPIKAYDQDGRVIAVFGSPKVDGKIDEVWNTAGIIIPSIKSSANVTASGEIRILWDDNALYTLCIVKDPVLNKNNPNVYEQDSVEIFVDEANDKAAAYQSDDIHFRVNYENNISTDSGDLKRFYTAVSDLLDDSGSKIGYIVETSIRLQSPPSNDIIMGFELQINDADTSGVRVGTINLFDKTGTAWSSPSTFGELILKGKTSVSVSKVNPNMLKVYVNYVERINQDGYVNSDILTEPLRRAKELLANDAATQVEIDAVEKKLRELVTQLDDGSGFRKVSELEANPDMPDPFTFFNGDKVKSTEDWTKRAEELTKMYQYYMYGVVPDTSDEVVTYKIIDQQLVITVEKGSKSVTFPVDFTLPDSAKVKKPENGYPIIMAYLWFKQSDYANDHGYATATLNTELIAVDNASRVGAFYELYPYGDVWTKQTGALVAWGWGISKIIDALEAGAAKELGIDPSNTILTGVSRWGKATLTAGAFDKRIRVTAPSCSGSGGVASFRYRSVGKTYDYSSIGITEPYKMGANEALGNLQSSGAAHWFNNNFLGIKETAALPFDQHLLAALCAEKDRYLFITASYLYEDWTNPPGMFFTYLAAKEVFDYLGLEENIAVHIHKEGHMVTNEDAVYLIDYCDYHLYGKKVKSNLMDLTSSLYMEEANYDPFFDPYVKK